MKYSLLVYRQDINLLISPQRLERLLTRSIFAYVKLADGLSYIEEVVGNTLGI